MTFLKKAVFLLSALFLCISIFFSVPVAAQNPPMQSALWKDLDNLAGGGGYKDVYEFLNRKVFLNKFPGEEDKNIIRLWLRIHLKDNPQYGLLYARLHLEEALSQSDYNTHTHREVIATAVMSFYTNALLLQSDLAACADETAGAELKSGLKEEERKYRRQYNKLDPALQAVILRAIERSRDNNKTRPPATERCKSGADYSANGDQYTIQQGDDGSKITHEDAQNTIPDTVPDEEWQKRREALYGDILESLK